MRAPLRVLGVALLLCLATGVLARDTSVQTRGVRPKDLSHYQGSTFTCLDGSGSFPSAQINDDYCDCADGSDEPGTSACANSHFYCRNTGAQARTLPSSRVNDGVCDCCDGSDELPSYSRVTCPNTCEEAGRASREALARDMASAEAGWAARVELLAKAQATLSEKRAKLEKYEKQMAEKKAMQESARALKEAEEAIEKAERDRRQEEKDRAQQEKAAAEEATLAAQQTATGAEVPPSDTDAVPASPIPADLTQDTLAAVVTEVEPDSVAPADSAAAAGAEPTENFPYPAEYAYKAPEADVQATKEEEKPTENFPYPAEYAYHAEAEDADSVVVEDDEEPQTQEEVEQPTAAEIVEPEAEEAEYVHPSGSGPPRNLMEAIRASPLLTQPFWQGHWSSVRKPAMRALNRARKTAVKIGTGKFNWSRLGRRWLQGFLDGAESLGDSTLDVLRWANIYDDGARDAKVAPARKHTPPTPTRSAEEENEEDDEDDDDDEEQHVARRRTPRFAPKENEWTSEGAAAARAEFDAISDKVSKLEKKLEGVKKALERNYGADGEFLHMDGACYQLPVKQYTYEVCPYGKASQKEGGSSTSLGTFDSLEADAAGAYVMKFTRGQGCWNGPSRSLTVHLRCGATDRLLSVEEPSKCVYDMQMETPAVCTHDGAHKLKRKWQAGGEAEHTHTHDEL